MNKTPSVSIIVPVYNTENYIEDLFLSIISQSYSGHMECLLIDDCGSDKSLEIAERLIEAYNGPVRFRIIHHKKNYGPSVARNTGIQSTNCDYIFFVDSDDKLYTHSIKNLVDAVEKENGTDIVLGSYEVSNPEHTINRFKYKYNVISGQPKIAKEFLSDNLYCMLPNKLIRREFIIENQLWLTSGILQGEDNLWSFQAFHVANKIITIPEVTYFYCIHSDSITHSIDRFEQINCARKICDEVKKDLYNYRYSFVDNDSLAYLDDLMKTKCGGLLNQIYMSGFSRTERLVKLKAIPNDLKALMATHLFSSSTLMRVIRTLFLRHCYGLFDIVMNQMYSRNT